MARLSTLAPSLNTTSIGLHDPLELTVEVRNISSRSVEEVAQLYLHQRSGCAARPVRELKAFKRLTLEPGETRTLRFTLGTEARRYWSPVEGTYVLDESTFECGSAALRLPRCTPSSQCGSAERSAKT